jgi:threonine dehydrogenase-like Zn-dependent dehydrogenase
MPRMKALLIEGPGRLRLGETPEPAWPAGEAVITPRLAGICNTDLELARGYIDFSGVPGHEFVGVVRAGPEHLLGRRVVGDINAACGGCEACRAKMRRHCPRRTVLGIAGRPGVLAERFSLPVENLYAAPDAVSDEEAVFTEPLAAALEILEQVHVAPGTPAAVLGDGKLGLLIAQVLARHGCRVRLYGHHERKLALARRWGVATVRAVDGPRGEEPGGEKFPLVVEATGAAEGFRAALSLVRPRGTLVMKSTYAPTALPELDAAKIVVDEITLVGSRCGPIAAALRMLAQGGLDVRSLIDHRLPFAQAEEAFARAAQKGTLKVLIQWPGSK